jgi:hypothetical protein
MMGHRCVSGVKAIRQTRETVAAVVTYRSRLGPAAGRRRTAPAVDGDPAKLLTGPVSGRRTAGAALVAEVVGDELSGVRKTIMWLTVLLPLP